MILQTINKTTVWFEGAVSLVTATALLSFFVHRQSVNAAKWQKHTFTG